MKQTPALFLILAFVPSCTTSQHDVQIIGNPLGIAVPANDWTVEVEIDNTRVVGNSKGGSVLFWNTGDEKYSPGTVGETSFIGLAPPLEANRLRQLKAAAVYDAITRAECEVLAYPVFWWEEKGLPFIYSTYTVHVKGNPGWVRKFTPIARENRPGINYLPNAENVNRVVQPQQRGQSSRATIYIDAASVETAGKPTGTNWNNWDEPWGSPKINQ